MKQFELTRGFLEHGRREPPSPARLAAEFLKAIEALGFRHFACCSHVDPSRPPPEAVMLHNYPCGWVRTFCEAKLHQIDPVLRHAESSPFPFFWDEAFRPETLTRSQRIMLADAARYGVTHGYTVPLKLSWMPGTSRASCSVIPDGKQIDPESYLAVEVLATSLYFLASRPFAPWLTAERVELTERERECLALVAAGKGDWAIAQIMGLSKSTAHYHAEQLKRRFGVTTRLQAVVQGLLTGQITFGDVLRRGTKSGRGGG